MYSGFKVALLSSREAWAMVLSRNPSGATRSNPTFGSRKEEPSQKHTEMRFGLKVIHLCCAYRPHRACLRALGIEFKSVSILGSGPTSYPLPTSPLARLRPGEFSSSRSQQWQNYNV